MAFEREKVLEPFIQQEDYMKERVANGIEQNRKGRFSLTIVNSDGSAVPGSKVLVKQKNHEFRLGANLFALSEMQSEEKTEQYKRLFADCFNLGTLPFYWLTVEPEEGKPRYAEDSPYMYRRPPIDLCLAFCEAYNIEPKAHCLDYDVFTPQWIRRKNDLQAIRKALYQRFAGLSERYAHRIPSWEVTNENLFLPTERNTQHFYQNDTVEWDFRVADRLFPLNKLIINESCDNIFPCFNGNRSAYYMLIERALNKGCRIDSIGLQYHMVGSEKDELELSRVLYSPEHIYQVLDRYADFGLPLQITEITIPCYRQTAEDEDLQAEILKNLYSIWFSHPSMEAIIYWDTVDGLEWRPYRIGWLREDLTPKKAYLAIRDLFGKTWRTNQELTANDAGKVAFKGFYGDYEITVCANGTTVTQSASLVKNGNRHFTITL